MEVLFRPLEALQAIPTGTGPIRVLKEGEIPAAGVEEYSQANPLFSCSVDARPDSWANGAT